MIGSHWKKISQVMGIALRSFSFDLYLILIRLISIRLSQLLVGVCCIYFTIIKFANFGEDTTELSNSFFVLLATLAALSFSYAKIQGQDVAVHMNLDVAGARCFHGAVLLILASVLKYALWHVKAVTDLDEDPTTLLLMDVPLGIMAGVLFLLAAAEAYMALRVISDFLVEQLLDHPILKHLQAGKEHPGGLNHPDELLR